MSSSNRDPLRLFVSLFHRLFYSSFLCFIDSSIIRFFVSSTLLLFVSLFHRLFYYLILHLKRYESNWKHIRQWPFQPSLQAAPSTLTSGRPFNPHFGLPLLPSLRTAPSRLFSAGINQRLSFLQKIRYHALVNTHNRPHFCRLNATNPFSAKKSQNPLQDTYIAEQSYKITCLWRDFHVLYGRFFAYLDICSLILQNHHSRLMA